MIITAAYILSGIISAGIILIGLRFLLTPYRAAADYGVPVKPDVRWNAFLSVKAIRDIASGLFIAILMLARSSQLLGWFMLAAAIIPIADATIVLSHDGTRTAAYGIHGLTAVVMLLISAFLLLGG
jgi:hypothetical protein